MARAQNSARGRFQKNVIAFPTSMGVVFNAYSESSNLLTGDSTGLVVAGAVKVSNKKYVSANSTGFIFSAAAVKPTTRSTSKWAFITNSTGVNSLAINTTGTTWKFVDMTSVLNSAAGYP